MKKKVSQILIPLFLIFHAHVNGTVLIQGNALSGSTLGIITFNQSVVAKAFNPATGDLFVGLTSPSSAPSGAFAISLLPRQNVGSQMFPIPTFQPIAASLIQSMNIDFLTLINSQGNTFPLIVAVPTNTPGMLNQTTLFSQTDGVGLSSLQSSTISQPLLGPAIPPIPDAKGLPISGISGIAAGITENNQENFIFAAVSTSASGGIFGPPGSGIAVVNAAYTPPPAVTSATLQLNQVAAVPGETGIKAVPFDGTIPQINFAGGLGNAALIVNNRVSMFWDDQLQRLYLGVQVSTLIMNQIVASVVLGNLDVNEQGELTLNTFLSSSALNVVAQNNIVAVKQPAVMPLSLAAAQLNTMHASTGPSYLIVWGGNGTITTNPNVGGGTTGNTIWALPLVDLQDTTAPTQGMLADKNAALKNNRFQTVATTAAGLTNSTDSFAMVGAGPLPQQPATPISGVGSGLSDPNGARDSLDIQVFGDTVYVAIATPQTDLDDAGVFYSQAMFDETGKIIRWTPWAKRAFPFNAFFGIAQNKGNVRYVSVDPVVEKIVAVDGTIGQTVRVNNWDYPQFAGPLPKLLTQALSQGCFSVLDLDQTTVGLGASGPSRYGLFGGINQVAFAITTLSRNTTSPFNFTPQPVPPITPVPAPQKLVNYFDIMTTATLNFIVTPLPSGAGAVKVLEYSRQPAGTPKNYFFAGTNIGLFVFAQTGGSGFDAAMLGAPGLGNLTKPPFSTGSWKLAPAPKGSIVDIKSSGLTLYVVTLEQQNNAAPIYKVYSIGYQDDIAAMFGTPTNINLIAQSGVDDAGSDLGATKAFYGIQIINMSIDPNPLLNTEQLVLATNNGLYMSSLPAGVQAAANQSEAEWLEITDSENMFYCGIGGMDTVFPTTVWPFSLGPLNNPKIYNRSSILQLNGGTNNAMAPMGPNPFMFVPQPFNANDQTDPGQAFASFDPISYFMSDGARRFFILHRETKPDFTNILQVSPYNVLQYTTNAPTILNNAVLRLTEKFYWIKQIGATGILMAGTESGVIALE